MTLKGETKMNTTVPAEVFPPGEFLRDELESRGWSQVVLAEILARPPRLISEIVSGKRAITPETAKGLAAALGSSAELWMNLESAYQLSRTRIETSVVARRAKLYGKFPVKELIRRGWVPRANDFQSLEKNVCKFFGVQSPDESPAFRHAAKKRQYNDVPQTLQLAWLNRAEQVAKDIEAHPYSAPALKEAIKELQKCLREVEDVKKASRILSRAGVRFVIVEYLPRAKLDGACFWIEKRKSPVIALSLRLDRIDNFWHTLFHEIDHVVNGEGKQTPIVDIVETEHAPNSALPREEMRANASAAKYCIPEEDLNEWVSQTPRVASRGNILAFAERVGVHPGLVVGQLQHRGLIPYSFHRELLEKVRSLVISATPTDGFGEK
jgi:HTH-type transcriptional regulator/antitoxin HigA